MATATIGNGLPTNSESITTTTPTSNQSTNFKPVPQYNPYENIVVQPPIDQNVIPFTPMPINNTPPAQPSGFWVFKAIGWIFWTVILVIVVLTGVWWYVNWKSSKG